MGVKAPLYNTSTGIRLSQLFTNKVKSTLLKPPLWLRENKKRQQSQKTSLP